MAALTVFSVLLLVGALLSDVAQRSVLSVAVLFLAGGFVLGPSAVGLVPLPADSTVDAFAKVALFAVLFTDGMRTSGSDLRHGWRLPGRALVLGLPLTLVVTGVLARVLVGLPWAEAFLLGAALSPTDPVFAAAIVGRTEVPAGLRHLLNVESGLNDGLALPIVVVLLELVRSDHVTVGRLALEVVLGVVLGVTVPFAVALLLRFHPFAARGVYEPLAVLAIGLLLFAVTDLTGANAFLSAFSGGVAVRSVCAPLHEAFHPVGEAVSETVKLAALLLLGAAFSFTDVAHIGVSGAVFVVLALLVARPVPILFVLARSSLPVRERIAAAWFGPKGFASVVLGLLLLHGGFPHSDDVFRLIAAVVALSIVAHSSTDVLVARWLQVRGAGSAGRESGAHVEPRRRVERAAPAGESGKE